VKRILVLGAGLVVKPLLDDLEELREVDLRLATLNVERARALLAGRPRATALEVDATRESELVPEVGRADIVVSLIPADQHVRIARACLDRGVPLVTTSYVSEEMRALDARARERGILLLNEMGLDPGIDHMSAVRLIAAVRRGGGRIVSFSSCCGAIPAPVSNTNPWGYKFAWSPRGVVLAARNPVRYLENGVVVERPFPDLFEHPRLLDVPGVGRLEAYPNRNCLRYLDQYGLAGTRDFFRGTLRYPGWCSTWHALAELNLLDLEPLDLSGTTWAEFLARRLSPGTGRLVERVARRLGVTPQDRVVMRLEWLGLLSDQPMPDRTASPLEALTNLLESRLRYAPGESDMVVLEHRCVAEYGDGSRRLFTSRMVSTGRAGDDSALARAVSLPVASACRLLLEGRIDLSGVQIPVDPRIARPVLLALEQRGLHVEESSAELETESRSGSVPR